MLCMLIDVSHVIHIVTPDTELETSNYGCSRWPITPTRWPITRATRAVHHNTHGAPTDEIQCFCELLGLVQGINACIFFELHPRILLIYFASMFYVRHQLVDISYFQFNLGAQIITVLRSSTYRANHYFMGTTVIYLLYKSLHSGHYRHLPTTHISNHKTPASSSYRTDHALLDTTVIYLPY
jgi:hypothetical protein